MRPIGRVFALGMGIACGARAYAEDDPLPMTAPSTGAPPAASAGALPLPLEPPGGGNGSGATVPGPGPSRPPGGVIDPGLPPFEPAGPSVVGDLPPPTEPAGLPGPRTAPDRVIRPVPRERGRPLTIESVPGGAPAGTGSRSPKPRPPMTAPRRPLGFLNRLVPPPLSINRGPALPRDSVTVEPGNDPASDAALKRRIEHQLRQNYGDRLQAVDVRVAGPDVTIRARATRFWQRRALRKSLESLPSLSGLRSTIEVE